MARLRVLAVALLVVGAVLTGLNLWGLGAGFEQRLGGERPPERSTDAEQVSGSLVRRPGESYRTYFDRLTASIHDLMTHTEERYVVPAHENWLLHAARYIVPSYRDYEFADHRRALERGAGLCTQFASAQFDVLTGQGLEPRSALFARHAIVAVRPPGGEEVLLDADFGVVMPFSLKALRANPSRARPYYLSLDPRSTPLPGFSRERIAAEAERAFGGQLVALAEGTSTPQRATAERVAYILKWPLPLLLLLLGVSLLPALRERRRGLVAAMSRRLRPERGRETPSLPASPRH